MSWTEIWFTIEHGVIWSM